MADIVVQTRVPEDVAAGVAFISSDEGESVSAWVRRLLVREVNLAAVKAWVAPARGLNPVQVFRGRESNRYVLRPRGVITPLDRAFWFGDVLERGVPDRVLVAEP